MTWLLYHEGGKSFKRFHAALSPLNTRPEYAMLASRPGQDFSRG